MPCLLILLLLLQTSLRERVENEMADLKVNDRAMAGLPGLGSDRQQRGAEAEAAHAGSHEVRHTLT